MLHTLSHPGSGAEDQAWGRNLRPGNRYMGRKNIDNDLKPLFSPSTVAVIGASGNPSKLGYHVMKSLTAGGYGGKIIPVNPGSKRIFDLDSVPSIMEFQGEIDVGIIVLPAKLVPAIFEECEKKQVRGIVLITAGFKEIDDPAGREQQELLARMANRAGIPVIGPNTFGMINIHRNLNASFTPEFSLLEKGGVSLISQSGGISHLLAFMAMKARIGFSKIIGLGNRLNVDFADMLHFLSEDADTRVIMLYVEGLDDPTPLMKAAETLRGKKPIVAYKTGSSRTGNQSSLSHTGSMAGRQEIYEGALRQAGVFCADSSQTLLDLAHALCVCPLPNAPRVAVLTGQAGPGMAASDICELEGLEIPPFRPQTQTTINALLPPLALRTNPVDMGPAWYDSKAIQGIVKAVMDDPNVDGILLLMMFASANKEAVPRLSNLLLEWNQKKPVVTCLVSPPGVWDDHLRRLEIAGAIVNLPSPERAAKAMASLWQYKDLQSQGNGGPA